MEKLYPDADEIRLQIAAVTSYLVNDEKINNLEGAETSEETKEQLSSKIKDLKRRRNSSEEAIDLILESYEYISDEKSQSQKYTVEQSPLARNKYITEMIEEGVLTKDGRRPVKNMNDVAEFLSDKGQKVTVTLLKDLGLQKPNGKPYADRTYQYALNLANTKPANEEKVYTKPILVRQKRKKST